MTLPTPDNDLVGRLAEEWRERLRQGEHPDLSEYTDRYPEHADEIRDLFPAIAMMEELKPSSGDASSVSGSGGPVAAAKPLERLGDFRILREVGRGGMGVVYEAEQESLGRRVALKILPGQALADAGKKKRFQREAKATARLHHTNIVPVFGVGEHEGMHYYVMQFIQGLGLDEVLVELKRLRRGKSDRHDSVATVSRQQPGARPKDISAAQVARSLLTGPFVPGAAPREGSGPETLTREANNPRPPGAGSVVGTESFKPRLASGSGVSKGPSAGSGSSASEVYLPGQSGQTALTDSGRHYWLSVARVGIQVAEALDYANSQGIIHRDIKPSNLLLDTQGNVWVTDFGLAKATSDGEDLTHTGDIVGTLRYMAPERFHGHADARGDIYSLGLTLYELLVQRPAFEERDRSKLIHQVTHEEPEHPRKSNPAIPLDLETIVLKAIDREPSRRYPTAGALAEDLKRFVEDKPIRARRVSVTERFWRWCRRNPALAAATGLAAAALVAVTILSIWFNITQSQANKDLQAEQERTEKALARSQKLAHDLAGEQRKTRKALTRSRQLAGNLAEEQKRTQKVLIQTKHLSAKLLVERGQALLERHEPALGMLWLARGLADAPADAVDLRHVARTNLAGLRSEMPVLRVVLGHPPATAPQLSPDGKTFWTLGLDQQVHLWDAASGKAIGPPVPANYTYMAVAGSPDGKKVLMGRPDHTAGLWDLATGKPLGTPFQHPSSVTQARISRDGKFGITASQDGTVCYWDVAAGKPRGKFVASGGVSQLGLSPDGKTFALLRPDGRVGLWKADTGAAIGELFGKDSGVSQIHFSPDSKLLVALQAQNVSLWDTATAKPAGRRLEHPNNVSSVVFSPAGGLMVTGCADNKVRLWETATGKPRGQPLEHSEGLGLILFRPDGKAVLTTSGGSGRSHLWDTNTGKAIGEALQQSASINNAVFSPDARLVVTANSDNTARLWDAHTGKPIGQPLAHPSSVNSVQFSPDGRTILTMGGDNTVRLWDLPTSRLALAPLAHLDWVRTVAFSPDGKKMVTLSQDSNTGVRAEARLWDTATGNPIGPPLLHKNPTSSVAFSADGKRLLTGSWDGTVRVWDTAVGRLVNQMGADTPGVVATHVFSPDGKKIATLTFQDVILGDADTGQPIGQPLPAPGSGYPPPVFSRDGKTIVTCANNTTIHLWEVSTGRTAGPPIRPSAAVTTLDLSPDGKTVVTGSQDTTAQRWEVATGKPIGPPMAHQVELTSVAFSPDGKRILTSGGKIVRVWDATTGQPISEPMQHPEAINAVAFSPDGRTILTGSQDQRARLWQAKTGQPLCPPLSHPGSVTAVAFSPDGKLVLTGCEDKRARLWRMPEPVAGTARQLVRWVEVSSGQEITREGLVRFLDVPTWQKRRQHLSLAIGQAFQPDGQATQPDLLWHQLQAAEYAAAGDWFAARWHLDRVLASQRRDWLAFAQRSRAALQLGQRDQAATDCAQALKWGPPETVRDWFSRQSPDYDKDVSWQTATWYLDQLLEARPKDGLAHVLRSKAHVQLAHRDKAAADFAKALELGPRVEIRERFFGFWTECQTRQEWETGLWYLDQLSKDGPGDRRVQGGRGQALVQLGRYEEGAGSFARAWEAMPGDNTWWQSHTLARLYLFDLAGYKKACAYAQKSYGQGSYANIGLLTLEACTLVPGDAQQPLTRASQLVAQNPTYNYYLEILGKALYRAGRFAEAVQRLDAALKTKGNYRTVPAWFFLAMAHHRLGHGAEARQWLERAVGWVERSTPEKPKDGNMGTPIQWADWQAVQLLRYEAVALIRGTPATKDTTVRLRFARAHFLLEQWDKAVEDYNTVLQTAEVSKTSAVWAERGRCLTHLGKWDKAAADFTKAIALKPDSAGLLSERGRCYRQLKQEEKAVEDLNRAVELRRAAFTKTPADMAAREALESAYRELAALQWTLHRPADALASLLEVRDLRRGNADQLYEIAKQLAQAISRIGADPDDLTAEEKDLRRKAAGEAMVCLNQAVLCGFTNSAALKTDKPLAALRSRSDFQRLLAHLERTHTFPAPTGEVRRFQGHENWVLCAAFSPDGRSVLSGGNDSVIRLWDVRTGKLLRRFSGHTNTVYGVAFSSNGNRFVSGSSDGTVRLWEVSSGKTLRQFPADKAIDHQPLFTQDGRHIIARRDEKTLCLYSIATGKLLRRFEGHTELVTRWALSPDGRSLLSGSFDGTVRLWEVATGKEIRCFEEPRGQVVAVAFSPRGHRAAAGGPSGIIFLWDLDKGRLLRRLEGHWDEVLGIAFSPDGRHLLSVDSHQGKKMIFWDAHTGQELHRFWNSQALGSLVYAKDGQRALTASTDGLVHLWSLSEEAARARDWTTLGRLDKAEAEYTRAIALSPKDPFLHVERGRFYAWQGDWDKAAADLSRALDLVPDDPQALTVAADFYQRRSALCKSEGKTKEAQTNRQQARTLFEKLLTLQPHNAAKAEELADFLLEEGPAWKALAEGSTWKVLEPATMTSAGGATLSRRPDGSILAGGKNPNQDAYTITARTNLAGITALRLEVLPDPSLPFGGPGRAPSNGNLALSEFAVSVQPGHGQGPTRAVRWQAAFSDHQVAAAQHYDKHAMNIGLAIDGDPNTYWEIWPKGNERHYAVFVPAEPLGRKLDTLLTFTLVFQSKYPRHNLGRFRLAVTTNDHFRRLAPYQVVTLKTTGWTKLGAVLWQRKEWRGAAGAFRNALSGPAAETGYAPFLLSLVHAKRGEHRQARQVLRAGLAWMDKNGGDDSLKDVAVLALSAVVAHHKDDVALLMRRADLLARLGQRDQARADYRKVLALEPKNAKCRLRLAQVQPDVLAYWNFEQDMARWHANGQCRLSKTSGGLLVENAGAGPHLFSQAVGQPGWKKLRFRARLKDALALRLYWCSFSEGNKGQSWTVSYSDINAQWFALPASGEDWAEYTVYLQAEIPFTGLGLTIFPLDKKLELESMSLRIVEGKDKTAATLRQISRAVKLLPKEPDILCARGDFYLRLGRPKKAAADFAAALKIDAHKTLTWHRNFAHHCQTTAQLSRAQDHFDFLLEAEIGKPGEAATRFVRGNLYARLGRWKDADADFARGLELDPKDHWNWYVGASLCLQCGHRERFARYCQEMLRRFGDSPDPSIAERVGKTCLLIPGAVPDLRLPLQLVDRSLIGTEKHPFYAFYLMAKGLAEYRAGHFASAIDWLGKADAYFAPTVHSNRAMIRLVRAMAYARRKLPDPDKACQALAEAIQLIDTHVPKEAGRDVGEAWLDWLHCLIVRAEAEKVVKNLGVESKK